MPVLRVSTALIGLAVPISTALDNLLLAVVLLGLSFNAPAVWQIVIHNRMARAACLLFGVLAFAVAYGSTPVSEALSILGKYIDLAFIPLFMLMFSEAKTRDWAQRAFIGAMGLTLSLSYLVGLLLPRLPDLAWNMSYLRWLKEHHWIVNLSTYDNPMIFHSHITQNNMMAFAVFLALLNLRDATSRGVKMAWGVFVLLGTANVLFMVQGRTGYIILLVLLCWFAWTTLARYFRKLGKVWGWKQGAIVMVASAILVIATFFVSPRLHDRLSLVAEEFQAWHPNLGNEQSSTGQRLDFYYNTAQIVRQNLLLGVGTGGFTEAFAHQVQGSGALPTHNPHNEYLMIAVQTGVLGLLLLLYLFYTEWRLAPLLETDFAQDAARGLVLAYMVNSLFNSALHDHADGLFFAFMTALLFSTLRTQKRE
jgi:O-antigen ligase